MTHPPPSNPPATGGKSAEELRRSTINMEKMIKKNVLAASRPGGMKRGLAVVEFFKQQQQQQQQPSDDGDAGQPPGKRSKKDAAMAMSTSTASASSLVGPPATPLIPKSASAAISATVAPATVTATATSATATATATSAAAATTSALLAAAQRGSPLRTSARASPLRQAAVRASPMRAVRASPLRQVFTSPSRRVVAPRLPEVTAGGVPPMHTPVLNLDALDATAATPLKPPVLPAKSPFQSFQSKFGQTRTSGVVKTPSPARPSPQLPVRRASPMPQQFEPTPAATPTEIVDLSEEKAPSATSQQQIKSSTTKDAGRATPTASSESLVMTTPPPKPLARSLFSSAASVATKSLCFSTEGVASSLDVSPDGECVVVAFTDGSVRLYEMDSTVPSDRHGYLLGHLDEESNQSSAGAHLRVKISGDGRYAFVGCRSGPRVMMSIHLHNYRNGKDTEDEDMDQLQKSFHSNSRLRGFSDATVCPLDVSSSGDAPVTRAYYLLCGLGVGTMYMWHFIEASQQGVEPEWRHLYSIPTNGNTVVIASFLPQELGSTLLRIAGKCEDKNMRVWNLEPTKTDEGETSHAVQGHFDVPSSKDVISFYGSYAYGIAPTGEACRFRIPSESMAAVRTYFDMERLDMGSSSKSRRSNIILESIYASDDGKAVVAVSAEGIFYYTNQAPEDSSAGGGTLRIIGRNASLNAQYKSPMKVYKPVQADSGLMEAVMAVATNPQYEEDGEEGYVNVDSTEAWAARWMKPSLGQDCWVCGVRNIRHWQSESQVVRKSAENVSAASSSASTSSARAVPRPSPTAKATASKAKVSVSSDSSPGSPVRPAKPRGIVSEVSRPSKPAPTRSLEESSAGPKKAKSKPAPVKRLDVDEVAVANDEKATDSRSYVEQIEQELARYKERHTKIVTEWKRRLKGERQMRRLWKDREKEFEGQLHDTFLKLDAAEQKILKLVEAQKDAEKRFIFEKLKSEQQSSVKVRYEQLCEQMQERMVALEHQQRVMEQTSRALLQEVDRHVQHSKQSVNGLVDRQQNECILCKDQPAVTAIVPCGHLCFCEADAEVYRRNFRGSDQITCPVCQREMISMLRIY